MSTIERKGIKRLAIALGVPYFCWWAFYGFASFYAYSKYDALLVAHPKDPNSLLWGRIWSDALDRIVTSLLWGVVVLLLALIVGSITLWVYRGFKPKE